LTDIRLTADNDLPAHPRHIHGLEAAIQQARLALRLSEGEAQQDETWELPWLEWLGQKPVPTSSIRTAVRDRLERIGFEVLELTVVGTREIQIRGTLRWSDDGDEEAEVSLEATADGQTQTLPAVTISVIDGPPMT